MPAHDSSHCPVQFRDEENGSRYSIQEWDKEGEVTDDHT